MVAYALAPRTPLPPSFLTQISQMRQPGVSFLLFFSTDLITQLDLSHETYFVTKGPDLYVQKEQQLLSLSPGTSSMFEDEKENRENENSLRSNGSGEFSLASVGDSRLRRQTTLHLPPRQSGRIPLWAVRSQPCRMKRNTHPSAGILLPVCLCQRCDINATTRHLHHASITCL